MKIGVISDTHIPVNCERIPQEIGKYFKDVDMIIHAGDLIELSVLDQLVQFTTNIEAVRGNMDCQKTLAKLPKKKIIKVGKYKIGLTHGWGTPHGIIERMAEEFDDVDVIVFGHSHRPVNEIRKGILFFNPGSATDVVYAKEKTIGILELNDKIMGTIISL